MTKKNLQYDVVLTTGKSARKMRRAQERKGLKLLKGKLESPLGKMRSRQDRKETAKALKIPFNPRYNNSVKKLVHTMKKDKRGYLRVTSELVEVK